MSRAAYHRQYRAQRRLEQTWRSGRSGPLANPRWLATPAKERGRALARLMMGMRRNPAWQTAWPAIVAHYGSRCLRCGSAAVLPIHVLPVLDAPAARHTLANLQPLCRACRHLPGDLRPDAGAWIIAAFPAATAPLHNTTPRARYGSNGWCVTQSNGSEPEAPLPD